jgi:nucleoside 2-deoxyribosyltransferase
MSAKLYLGGHMPKSYDIAKDWRKPIEHRYFGMGKYILLSPTEFDNNVHNEKHTNALAARDEILLNACDLAVINLDLDVGKCLGVMWEFGYLRAHNKPVILWNHHKGMPRTKFLEHKSSVVVYTIDELFTVLDYMGDAI